MVNKYDITINGKTFEVQVGDVSASPVEVIVNGQPKSVTFSKSAAAVTAAPAPAAAAPAEAPAAKPQAAAPSVPAGGQAVKAPMPGKILAIAVNVGDKINEGDTVCTLEAMKMEMPIAATASGTVTAVLVGPGQTVAFDDGLIAIG